MNVSGNTTNSAGFLDKTIYENHIDSPKLHAFLQNVFKQVDAEKFMSIYREAVEAGGSSRDIYERLLNRAGEAKGGTLSQVSMGLNALQGERDTLADNVEKVMDPKQPRDGYVEIAMPGRMIKVLKPMMGLTGRVTVVSEHESLIQSGWPRPYDAFETLTYDPLPLAERSVDVISVFPGLHHCPEDKLDAFIDSIYSTLRDGGIFLLRDHDCRDQEMTDLAAVVHSVFNACTGVSVEEEGAEVRNFKGLDEWKAVLEAKGLHCVSEPLVREGDSTENALVKFVKVGTDAEHLDVIREKMISERSSYTREATQTYLTSVEWLNVESSQNIGNYENYWEYPYFRDTAEAWKTYGKSLNAVRKVHGFSKMAKAQYAVESAVLLTMMTVEYLAKGILFTPMWAAAKLNKLLPQAKADANWEGPAKKYQQYLKGYGERLEQTPYYAQSYLPYITEYWKSFAEGWNVSRQERSFVDMAFDRQTVNNIVTGLTMTADLVARAVNAAPMNWFLGGEDNGDARTIGIIVKGDLEDKGGLRVIEEPNNAFKGIVSPRYKGLSETLVWLAGQDAEVVEIAGQTQIQVDMLVDRGDASFGEEKLHERRYLADSTKKIVALTVKVRDLPSYAKDSRCFRVYDF